MGARNVGRVHSVIQYNEHSTIFISCGSLNIQGDASRIIMVTVQMANNEIIF